MPKPIHLRMPRTTKKTRARFLCVAATAGVLLASLSVTQTPATAASVPGTSVTYTTDADFDQGVLTNVNHDAPNNDQLQLNETTSTFPFIWVALSQRCTIAKINTETGVILGEYRTVSDGTTCRESSRTTVAIDGSVWVGHRGPGGVTHVGQPELNQCIDRNNDGVIQTSTGYGDVKAWPGGNAAVAAAQDECIIHHVDTVAAGLFGDSRHMSIDASNKLWVGDFAGGSRFIRINGTTGVIETPVKDLPCGGYGGLIDANGVIWSAQGPLLRWDPNAPDSPTNPRCINVGVSVYGVAIDGNGNVWVSEFGNRVAKISPTGATLGIFPTPSNTGQQGLAVDGDGDVWVSTSLSCAANCTVTHLKNDGTLVGSVPNPTGAGSTGVSVDAAGNIWTANRGSNSATRIDPNGGPLGCGGSGCGDGTRVGAVDKTVSFPAGPGARPAPLPYNYSDMTGQQLFSGTAPQGSWTVVQDGGAAGTGWGKITWNTEPEGSVPDDSSILVEARAADSEAALGTQVYAPVANGTTFSQTGRFIQVRMTMKPTSQGLSPVLSDITIETANRPPVFDHPPTPKCGSTIEANSGDTVEFTVQASDPNAEQDVTLSASGVPAGATLTPALPAAGNPVGTAFSWSPGPADEGSHVVTFTASDPTGAQVTCAITINVVALIMTGRATVANVTAVVLGTPLTIPVSDTGPVATKVPLTRTQGGSVDAGIVSATLIRSRVVAVVGKSTSTAEAATVKVAAPLLPGVTATGLTATSETTCAGSTGDSDVVTLKVGAVNVAVPNNPAPNTTVTLAGGIKVVFNEQVPVPGGLRVTAVHVTAPLLDVVLATATSDIHNCV